MEKMSTLGALIQDTQIIVKGISTVTHITFGAGYSDKHYSYFLGNRNFYELYL
jgi:hypothetical protein